MKIKIKMKGQAFTLIELIGVMAIIGILSAVVLPPLISKIEDANTTKEDANLEEIARALVKGIMVSGRIPNPNLTPFTDGGWGSIAQNHTSLGCDALLYVFPPGNGQNNGGENQRRVYLDNTLMSYLASITGSANVPFPTPSTGWPTNTAGGVAFPNQAMPMYIVSGSKRGLDLYCTPNQPGVMMNPAPQDSPAFGAALIGDLRNWVKTAAPNGSIMVPGSIARWGNNDGTLYRRGEYLHVKMVDLRPLFCRVELIDTACPPTATITVNADSYLTPDVTFFSGAAAFDVRDTSSVPITTARALNNTDKCVLRNPTPQYIDRTSTLNPVSINNDQTAGAPSKSTATPSLNPQPRFRIPISGSASTPTAGMFPANIQTFYVLKGTSLQLWDNASGDPVLTTTIESDSSFKYFGTTWTRVD